MREQFAIRSPLLALVAAWALAAASILVSVASRLLGIYADGSIMWLHVAGFAILSLCFSLYLGALSAPVWSQRSRAWRVSFFGALVTSVAAAVLAKLIWDGVV